MCRLFLLELKGNYENVKNDIEAIMPFLETSAGGHGNTFAFLHGKKINIYREGDFTQFPLQKAMKLVEKHKDADYMFFHTRIRSTGKLTAKNLHPAVADNVILFQNGTVSYRDAIKIAFNSDWDTQITANLLNKTATDIKKLTKILTHIHSVWIGVYKGVPFVASGGGDLVTADINGSLFIGSELPMSYKNVTDLDDGSIWINGKWLKQVEKKRYSYGEYGGYRYGWGDYLGSVYHTRQAAATTKIAADITVGYCSICGRHTKRLHKNSSLIEDYLITRVKVCDECLKKVTKSGKPRELDGKITGIFKLNRKIYPLGDELKRTYVYVTDGKKFKAYPKHIYSQCDICGDIVKNSELTVKDGKSCCRKCLLRLRDDDGSNVISLTMSTYNDELAEDSALNYLYQQGVVTQLDNGEFLIDPEALSKIATSVSCKISDIGAEIRVYKFDSNHNFEVKTIKSKLGYTHYAILIAK